MSQYLSIYARKKDNPEIKLCLVWWCTTPARRISDLGAFPYTSEYKVLTEDLIDRYIHYIKDEIEHNNTFIESLQEDIDTTKALIIKAENEVAYEHLREDLSCSRNSIAEVKDENKELQDIINEIKFCVNIAHDNKDWELIYNNC